MSELSAPNVTYDNWDPFKGRIYNNGIGANDFITASTVALFATPEPKLDPAGLTAAKVIGVIQDWNISQTKQSPQLFECGSNGKYTLATGRVAGTMQMSRVLYNGSNLLYLLYAGQDASSWYQLKHGGPVQENRGPTDIAGFHIPNKHGFMINLGSSLFLRPLGIIVVMQTAATAQSATDKNVAAFFLEDCYINSHGMGASAGAPYVGEQASLTFEGVYPINVSTDASSVAFPAAA